MNSCLVAVKVNGKAFDVAVGGEVFQESRSGSWELDEARLQASDTFLAEARQRGLTREQYRQWSAVHLKTDLKNFHNPERHRAR